MEKILSILVFLAIASISSAIKGEIISCSGWKLNKLPEVRRFLKDPGHADAYEGLEITWKSGKVPSLTITQDNGNTEVIDLSNLTTTEIHDMLSEKGFERKFAGTKSSDLRARKTMATS